MNCISTEFTAKKHGGEKGVPFRLQVDTYETTHNNETNSTTRKLVFCASSQVKVFKVKMVESDDFFTECVVCGYFMCGWLFITISISRESSCHRQWWITDNDGQVSIAKVTFKFVTFIVWTKFIVMPNLRYLNLWKPWIMKYYDKPKMISVAVYEYVI